MEGGGDGCSYTSYHLLPSVRQGVPRLPQVGAGSLQRRIPQQLHSVCAPVTVRGVHSTSNTTQHTPTKKKQRPVSALPTQQRPKSPPTPHRFNYIRLSAYLRNRRRNSLPLDLFDVFDSDDHHSYPVPAYSKFFRLDGSWTWEHCQVLQYFPDRNRYLIKWDHNGKQKEVSRFVPASVSLSSARLNLRFEDEDANDFDQRLRTAQTLREEAQELLVCHCS